MITIVGWGVVEGVTLLCPFLFRSIRHYECTNELQGEAKSTKEDCKV